MRHIRHALFLLPAASLIWAALLAGAPWLGSIENAPDGIAAVSAGTYLVGSIICHQKPERTFRLAGAHLPVCARCAGLYLSTAAGVVLGACWLLAFRKQASEEQGRCRADAVNWRWWLVAAAVPTVATLLVEWTGAARPSNAVRAASAIPLGLVAGAILTALVPGGMAQPGRGRPRSAGPGSPAQKRGSGLSFRGRL